MSHKTKYTLDTLTKFVYELPLDPLTLHIVPDEAGHAVYTMIDDNETIVVSGQLHDMVSALKSCSCGHITPPNAGRVRIEAHPHFWVTMDIYHALRYNSQAFPRN